MNRWQVVLDADAGQITVSNGDETETVTSKLDDAQGPFATWSKSYRPAIAKPDCRVPGAPSFAERRVGDGPCHRARADDETKPRSSRTGQTPPVRPIPSRTQRDASPARLPHPPSGAAGEPSEPRAPATGQSTPGPLPDQASQSEPRPSGRAFVPSFLCSSIFPAARARSHVMQTWSSLSVKPPIRPNASLRPMTSAAGEVSVGES